MRTKCICLWLFVMLATGGRAQEMPPLKLIATTPLPGFSGDFDHFAVDLKGNRLFLSSEEKKSIPVFDLHTGRLIYTITGFFEPHSLLYLPKTNKLIVADEGSADAGVVELVSGEDYKILATIKVPPGADSAEFNPVDGYYYVATNGAAKDAKSHLLNIIDTNSFRLVGSISLPGYQSEAMKINRAGNTMYVNLRTTDEIGVIDLVARKLIDKWAIPEGDVPNSIALDEPHHRLFMATHKPPKFYVWDTDTHQLVTVLQCAAMNDDMWLDAPRKRIYVSGTETTSVFAQRDANTYEHISEIPTGFRARTSIFVPELNRLYVAVSGKGKPDAKLALLIFEVKP
jgi:DNA-binding beta-propeller fold protein YncE